MSTIGTLIIILILVLGIFAPLSGYTEWELVEETELVSLSNSTGTNGNIFLIRSGNDYSYRIELDSSEFGTETSNSYVVKNINANDSSIEGIEEIEDKKCSRPVIKIYERKGKKSIWTFAAFSKQMHYVFYVPEGTIEKNISLK